MCIGAKVLKAPFESYDARNMEDLATHTYLPICFYVEKPKCVQVETKVQSTSS